MQLDFYEGIEGETLRIESESRDELVSLRELFKDLAAERRTSAELIRIFDVRSSSVARVILMRVTRRDFYAPEVIASEATFFEWRADPIDYGRYTGLIDGLLDEGTTGNYQLLTSPEPQSITVELTTKV